MVYIVMIIISIHFMMLDCHPVGLSVVVCVSSCTEKLCDALLAEVTEPALAGNFIPFPEVIPVRAQVAILIIIPGSPKAQLVTDVVGSETTSSSSPSGE